MKDIISSLLFLLIILTYVIVSVFWPIKDFKFLLEFIFLYSTWSAGYWKGHFESKNCNKEEEN